LTFKTFGIPLAYKSGRRQTMNKQKLIDNIEKTIKKKEELKAQIVILQRCIQYLKLWELSHNQKERG
jgi:hypothetical protein